MRRIQRVPIGITTTDTDRIAERPVFCRALAAMARIANALPVTLIPEQLEVALVRPDMVDDLGRRHPALTLAHDAQRMRLDIGVAGFDPAMVIKNVTALLSLPRHGQQTAFDFSLVS